MLLNSPCKEPVCWSQQTQLLFRASKGISLPPEVQLKSPTFPKLFWLPVSPHPQPTVSMAFGSHDQAWTPWGGSPLPHHSTQSLPAAQTRQGQGEGPLALSSGTALLEEMRGQKQPLLWGSKELWATGSLNDAFQGGPTPICVCSTGSSIRRCLLSADYAQARCSEEHVKVSFLEGPPHLWEETGNNHSHTDAGGRDVRCADLSPCSTVASSCVHLMEAPCKTEGWGLEPESGHCLPAPHLLQAQAGHILYWRLCSCPSQSASRFWAPLLPYLHGQRVVDNPYPIFQLH